MIYSSEFGCKMPSTQFRFHKSDTCLMVFYLRQIPSGKVIQEIGFQEEKTRRECLAGCAQ